MTKELKMKLAKVFIAFSFVLVFVGIGLDLDNKTLMNPVTGTHTIGRDWTRWQAIRIAGGRLSSKRFPLCKR